MRLYCYFCGKSVSTEVDGETVVRAILICPECLERLPADALAPLGTPAVFAGLPREPNRS